MATGSQLGGIFSGAAQGFTLTGGNPFGALAGGLFGFLSGDDGSTAKTDLRYAQYNADMVLQAGQANAAMIAGLAGANAALTMAAAKFNIGISSQVDQYNAKLRSFLGDFNASLLENEAQLVWEAAELDVMQMENQFARDLGTMRANYGKSGVLMDQDSTLEAQIDAQTQHELDVMIVRHGADLQAKKLQDAAARSRWEGNVEAQSIMYEGFMNNVMQFGQAALTAAGQVVQGNANAAMMMYNSQIQANQILVGGQQDYASYQSADRQAMMSGLFSAAGGLYANYMNNKVPTVGTGFTGGGSLRPQTTSWSGFSNARPVYLSSAWAPYQSPLL